MADWRLLRDMLPLRALRQASGRASISRLRSASRAGRCALFVEYFEAMVVEALAASDGFAKR